MQTIIQQKQQQQQYREDECDHNNCQSRKMMKDQDLHAGAYIAALQQQIIILMVDHNQSALIISTPLLNIIELTQHEMMNENRHQMKHIEPYR